MNKLYAFLCFLLLCGAFCCYAGSEKMRKKDTFKKNFNLNVRIPNEPTYPPVTPSKRLIEYQSLLHEEKYDDLECCCDSIFAWIARFLCC